MMRMFFTAAMVISIIFILMKWKYRILNGFLNWKQGRKYLVPIIANVILWKKKKEMV
ncbi:hypothetical protein [Oceanobacillus sojae]|uniref:Uncharacterized protein n=1 Tax=Oceanobacillus sojae TaxID=582851 RepID=A0A511ZIV8_9BACI|nr:hypothetical protein [Oceanobacillus sojae]GEN87383.1 hypothetical protein OSO01_21220 [Oceanobacillus sojae]